MPRRPAAPRFTRCPPVPAAAAALAAMLCLGAAGCDSGHRDRRVAPVHHDQLCEPATAASLVEGEPCPPCSSLDSQGLCRDRFYAAGVRCTSDKGCGATGHCRAGRCVFADADEDGVDDALEREAAERNLPALVLHPDESCGGPRAIIYRSRPHPSSAARLAITYVVLYQRDCGFFNGHLGDDEAMAITVDLDAQPGPAATVGILSSAHRNTLCDSTTTCETAPGMRACAPPGAERTVVFASADKHANYLDISTCRANCFDRCVAGPIDLETPLLDVGQPEAPMSTDLTHSGLLQASMGWHPQLLHFDPWSPGNFGDAGRVRLQLLELTAPPGLTTSD